MYGCEVGLTSPSSDLAKMEDLPRIRHSLPPKERKLGQRMTLAQGWAVGQAEPRPSMEYSIQLLRVSIITPL